MAPSLSLGELVFGVWRDEEGKLSWDLRLSRSQRENGGEGAAGNGQGRYKTQQERAHAG